MCQRTLDSAGYEILQFSHGGWLNDLELTHFEYAGDLETFASGQKIYGGRDIEDIKARRYNRLTGRSPARLGPLSRSFDVALVAWANSLTRNETDAVIAGDDLPDSAYQRLERELEGELTPIQKAQIGAFVFTGRRIAQGIKAATGNVYPFDPRAAYLQQWLESNGATLIQNVSDATRRTVRQILIENSLVDIQSRTVIANKIRNEVPIIQRHVKSVNHTFRSERDRLINKGVATEIAEKRAGTEAAKHADRLRRWRAWNITRTELSKSWAYSSLETMRDAQLQGMFGDRRLEKLWLTARDERVCSICGPMDGTTIPIDNLFDVIDSRNEKLVPNLMEGLVGQTAYIYAHFSCRCDGVYVLTS